MIPEKFGKAIGVIFERLNRENLSYAFIGSTNCALQGMDISPRDLDLVMRLKDLKQIPRLFADYSSSRAEKLFPDSGDPTWTAKLKNHPAYNVRAYVEGVEMQILGEKDDGDYVSKLVANKLIYVPFNGLRLPCFTLEAEAEAYEETYRPEKAERIRKFLETNK